MEAVEGQVIADIGNEEDEKAQTDAEPDDVYNRCQFLLPEDPECRLEVIPYHVHAPNVSQIYYLINVPHCINVYLLSTQIERIDPACHIICLVRIDEHSLDIFGIFVESVITKFVPNIQGYQDNTCYADSQTGLD
jgi:hypothetical protein